MIIFGRLAVVGSRRVDAAVARQRHCLAEGFLRYLGTGFHRWRRIDPPGPARHTASQQSNRQDSRQNLSGSPHYCHYFPISFIQTQ
jgi:hypothetical protein